MESLGYSDEQHELGQTTASDECCQLWLLSAVFHPPLQDFISNTTTPPVSTGPSSDWSSLLDKHTEMKIGLNDPSLFQKSHTVS